MNPAPTHNAPRQGRVGATRWGDALGRPSWSPALSCRTQRSEESSLVTLYQGKEPPAVFLYVSSIMDSNDYKLQKDVVWMRR
jgi:hypothetical protein